MASATHKPKFADLESEIQNVYRCAHIAAEMISDILESGKKLDAAGDYRGYTLTDDQIGDALFISNEAQYWSRLLRDQFYEAFENERAN